MFMRPNRITALVVVLFLPLQPDHSSSFMSLSNFPVAAVLSAGTAAGGGGAKQRKLSHMTLPYKSTTCHQKQKGVGGRRKGGGISSRSLSAVRWIPI